MKLKIIDQVIAREGGFTSSIADSGGATMYGITEEVARRHGYTGQMHELPRSTAVEIYSTEEFWPKKFDEILDLSPAIAAEVFDTCVNLSLDKAAKYLQRSLNVLNREEQDYPDIAVDGVAGSKTVKALAAFLAVRRGQGEKALMTAINCLQGNHYITLTERRKKDEAHLFGWLKHRIQL